MHVLKITWLGACPLCGCTVHSVESKNSAGNWLYDDEKVTCTGCAHTGKIQCDEQQAEVRWDNK